MCGVIGYSKIKADYNDLRMIRTLLLETEIRGKHATGISWVSMNKIHTVKEPVGAEEFLKNFDLTRLINENRNIAMIGHIRYSTSDLRYNQPFSNDKYAIVHNGVISQEAPENWPIKCETGNDSEMVLHVISDLWKYKHPLEEFPESSQAVTYLNVEGIVGGYRNGQRPLWMTITRAKNNEYDERVIFTSTLDIAKRSGLVGTIKTEMNKDYSHIDGEVFVATFQTNQKDLQ